MKTSRHSRICMQTPQAENLPPPSAGPPPTKQTLLWKPSVQRIVNTLSQTITPKKNAAKHKNLIPPPPHPTLLPTTVDDILSELKA